MKKYIVVILAVFFAMNAKAQNGNVLTIDSCFALAKANNAKLKTSSLEIKRAQEVKAQAFTKFFPQVQGAAIGYNAYSPILRLTTDDVSNVVIREVLEDIIRLLEPFTGFDGEISMLDKGSSIGVIAAQPVFMGFQILNGNRLAEVGIEAAELQSEVTEREVLENIESSYYLVLGLQQKVKTVETALAMLDTIDNTVNAALKAGLVTKNDALKVALEKNKLKAQQLQLNDGIFLASRLLCQQIGIEMPENGLVLDFDNENVNKKFEENIGFVRPEVQLLELQVQAEKLRRKMTVGATSPNLIVGGAAYYGNMISRTVRSNALLFISLRVPMTQWWETSHKLKEHDIKINQYEIDRQNLTEQMSIQEDQAYTNMVEAEALLRSDSAAYKMAFENYRVERLNYNAGLNTITDVLQANTILLQADNAITDRNITLISARRRYHDLTGK